MALHIVDISTEPEVPVAAPRWYILQARGCVARVDGVEHPVVPWVWHDDRMSPYGVVSIVFEEKEGFRPPDVYMFRRADGAVAVAAPADWYWVAPVFYDALRANLPGWLADWSPQHRPHRSVLEEHFDGGIRTHLCKLHLAGVRTLSSCQGGHVPIAVAALARWGGPRDPDWTTGPTIGDKVWGRKKPHLIVSVGPGHGGGGVAHGEMAMLACPRLPDWVPGVALATAAKFSGVPGIVADVEADETESYVVLTTSAFPTDVQAQAWWDAVVAAAST